MKDYWHNKELNDGLGSYKSPMDFEQAWEDLEAKRKPKKKKRVLFIFWFFGLTLISVVGFFILNSKGSDAEKDLDYAMIKASNIPDVTKDIKKVENTKVAQNLESSTSNKAIDKGSKDNVETLASTKDNYKTSENINDNYERSGRTKDNNFLLTSKESVNKTIPPANDITNQFLDSKLEKPNTEIEIYSTDLSLVVKKSEVNNEYVMGSESQDIVLLPSINFKKISSQSVEVNDDLNLLQPKVNQPTVASTKSHIGLSTSYSFLTSGNLWDESNLDAYSIFTFYEKPLSKQLYIKTGILFQQFTNRLDIKEERTYFETEDNRIIKVNNYLDGSIEEIYGSKEIKYVETTSHAFYNRYRFVNLPILLGGKINLASNSNLSIEGGLSTSLFTAHTGNIHLSAVFKPFNEVKGLKIKSFGVISGILNIHFEHNVRNRYALFAGSQISYQFNDAIQLEKGISFASYGISLGGKMVLN